jgi:hypothetical protein
LDGRRRNGRHDGSEVRREPRRIECAGGVWVTHRVAPGRDVELDRRRVERARVDDANV